ncbi:MAG TPA: hemerythrin domain-containing protein [Anaeromyxobacter sp.]
MLTRLGATAAPDAYFTEALPLHARDEEESVLPRLHGRDSAVDAELAAMEREHREHGPPLEVLVRACLYPAALCRLPYSLSR